MEVGVGEEEEGDFELGVGGGKVGECGGVGEGGGAVEEGEVVELVGDGDWEGRVTRREEARGKEEEDWEGKEEGEGEDEWSGEHGKRCTCNYSQEGWEGEGGWRGVGIWV